MISASALLALVSALLILLIGMLGDAIATRLGRLNANAAAGVSAVELLFAEEPENASGETSAEHEPAVARMAS
jgi:hypothetical protein